MKKLTQDDKVLRHLRDYGSITSWDAITEYGITRLSAVIFRLRNQGFKIEGEMIRVFNRYGEEVSCKKYILEV